MRTITHREMRNDSAAILRAVAEGEEFLVTNNGEPAAIISAPTGSQSRLDQLVAQGRARAPRKGMRSMPKPPPPVAGGPTNAEVLADLRRPW